MAAAYNVLLGGAFFAMEVLLGSFSCDPLAGIHHLHIGDMGFVAPSSGQADLHHRGIYGIVLTSSPGRLWPVHCAGCSPWPFIRLLGWAKAEKPKGWQYSCFRASASRC